MHEFIKEGLEKISKIERGEENIPDVTEVMGSLQSQKKELAGKMDNFIHRSSDTYGALTPLPFFYLLYLEFQMSGNRKQLDEAIKKMGLTAESEKLLGEFVELNEEYSDFKKQAVNYIKDEEIVSKMAEFEDLFNAKKEAVELALKSLTAAKKIVIGDQKEAQQEQTQQRGKRARA